ncbi:fibronectin type III domain-containing protein [Longibacter sp.]|uniref:fibronectin type III domain-containing protein n=1 Tax=Longibacter sp. TaxID=2045415 RepID=UPI003EBD31D4
MPNQTLTSEAARSGDHTWKIESFSGCDPSCYYAVGAWKLAADLDLSRPIRFPVWAKAPPGHGDLHIQLKYEAGGESHYPGKAQYEGTGAWERLEVHLDLSQISDLNGVWAAVRHVSTTGAPAYIDDLQLATGGPAATTYDLEVATDAGFTNVVEAWTDVNAPAAENRQVTVEGLIRTTAYHWRVRGTNAGGTGSWTRGVFTTTDRAPRHYYLKAYTRRSRHGLSARSGRW